MRAALNRLAKDSAQHRQLLAVLHAFKFENDHLHEFHFREQHGKRRLYYHDECDRGPYSYEVMVGEAELPVKSTIKFRFDFGAGWRFLLHLERIDPDDQTLQQPKIIESEGAAPVQYPNWEEQEKPDTFAAGSGAVKNPSANREPPSLTP